MDMDKILDYVENIADNLEGLIKTIGDSLVPSQAAIFIDEEQEIQYVSCEDALRILDSFGKNSASVMIGRTDYILIYDASKKITVDGEAYLPSGYLVMKLCEGLHSLDESDINAVLPELRSRICTLALGQYRVQTYKLS